MKNEKKKTGRMTYRTKKMTRRGYGLQMKGGAAVQHEDPTCGHLGGDESHEKLAAGAFSHWFRCTT